MRERGGAPVWRAAITLGSSLARREVLLLVACVVAGIYFASASPHFLTQRNLTTIFNNSVELLLIAVGMTFILATAGIDISVGAAMGISAVLVGFALQEGWPTPAVALLGPAIGIGLGLLSAVVIVFGRVPPIIATLGLFGIYRAAIFLILGGRWISGLSSELETLVRGQILGIPVQLFQIGLLYLVAYLVLRWTRLGTAILAVGGNERSAHLAGIRVTKAKFFAYGMTGLLVGFAAVLYVARYRNVETGIGSTIALDAIVAAILGGSTVLGGRANLLGTMLGVVLVRILQNGFVLAGFPSLWEQVVIGVLLLVALTVDALATRLLSRRAEA